MASRTRREEAWRSYLGELLKRSDDFEDTLERLLAVRRRIAESAGAPGFWSVAFKRMNRYDYGPEVGRALCAAVEKAVVPVLREQMESLRRSLDWPTLRPWDLLAKAGGREPLKPFADAAALVSGCSRIFRRIDPDFGREFDRLRELGLVRTRSGKGIGYGGYSGIMLERRLPFIMLSAKGSAEDLVNFLHESGHSLHTIMARENPEAAYRLPSADFAELVAFAMEYLAWPALDEAYRNPADLARARKEHLLRPIRHLVYLASLDTFEHWLYDHPGHARKERMDAWLDIQGRFSVGVDWTGLERERAFEWYFQPMIFTGPFGVGGYGVAHTGALGLWHASRRDPAGTISVYKQAMSLGSSRTIPDLFASAGLPFDFGEERLGALMIEASAMLKDG